MIGEVERDFLESAYSERAIHFEEVELRSGRVAPYYVQVSRLVRDGRGLSRFKDLILDVLEEQRFIRGGECQFDVVFGPAYGGISLAIQTVVGIYEEFGINIPWLSNRKEKKQHGISRADGIFLEGTSISDFRRVLVLEDVITSGGTLRETIELFRKFHMTVSGVIVLFDREERGIGEDALSEIGEVTGARIHAVSSCSGLLEVLEELGMPNYSKKIVDYRDKYGFFPIG